MPWPTTRVLRKAEHFNYPISIQSYIVCGSTGGALVYAIAEEEDAVDVLAVRRRPPYDYGDLEELIAELK